MPGCRGVLGQDAQHLVGVVGLYIAASRRRDIVDGVDIAALQRPGSGRHLPVLHLPVDIPANGDAIDLEHLSCQLLGRQRLSRAAKVHGFGPRFCQNCGQAAPGD